MRIIIIGAGIGGLVAQTGYVRGSSSHVPSVSVVVNRRKPRMPLSSTQ